MKRETLIGLGVAIILGVLAVFLANTYLTGRERQLADSPEGTVKVAVAAIPLAYGNEITADKVRFVSYPATSLPPGTYRTMEELLPAGKNRVALRPILVNQPLLAADLSGEGQGASIAALLPDGMRAASVRINDVSGVAGFIKPNDTVDVLITRQPGTGPGMTGASQVTDVLLQNIRVIAMDQNAAGNDGKPQVSRVATLEVSPVDAQKLALGQQLGDLSLVLRKPGEEQNLARVETVSLNDLRYSYYSSLPNQAGQAAAPAAAAPLSAAEQQARINRLSQPSRPAAAPPSRPRPKPAPAPRAPNTVDVTRGTQTSTYEVGGNAR
nr:Flp pilus assembly protein CpaB [uncultured Sphingomonas sp.]